MSKKNAAKQHEDYELPDSVDFEDFGDFCPDHDVEAMMDSIIDSHFSKMDMAFKLTKMALEHSSISGVDQVFDVYKKAVQVINDASPIQDTMKDFGLLPDPTVM